MKVSRRWLEAFLRRPLESRELVDTLARLGAPVDAVVPLHADLREVIIGLVEAVRPHPNADRLRLCVVDAGGPARLQVVCGASNVEPGRKYPFAPVGASLPGGIKLERRKIRGETSEGMLCSMRELGLGDEHEGIMTLETDADPGTSFLQALGLEDERLELDVPPVRPDLLGHKGVARELAAAYQTTFRLPEIPGAKIVYPTVRPSECRTGVVGGVEVTIEPDAACARFTGAVIRGVKIGHSPEWLRRRLESVGQRSLCNVVDATNYVLLELGQPLHAYDVTRLAGPALIVRRARPGERLVTLDNTERAIPEGTTVVADRAGIAGIGGIMGGLASEVSEATTDIFLEAAWWHPGPLRQARKQLGILTEASHRFERGTDLWGLPDALRRCIDVVLATGGGTLDQELLDLWPEPANPPRIFLRTARAAQVLGIELPLAELERCLLAVGATVVAKPGEGRLAVDAPGWRPDLQEEVDLVEEVARIHGYQNFPDTLRPFRSGNQTDAPIEVAAAAVRRHLVAEGLYEAILLGVGPDLPTSRPPDFPTSRPSDLPTFRPVPVLNPISSEHGFLRSHLLPGLVRQAEANWANQVRDIRLFEVGTAFQPGDPAGRPLESTHVAALLTGARAPAHWSDGGKTPDCDLWDLKGLFERSVSLANPLASVQVEEGGWIARMPDGREVGRAGPLAADAPPWAAPLFGLEVEIDPAPRQTMRYARLPTVPAAARDLALLVPEGVPIADVEALVRGAAGELLEAVRVIDEYRGAGLPAGRRSVAVRLVLRGSDRTLRDQEVDGAVQRVLNVLGRSLDVTVRTS
jgi:phenylalanyl-tRNA synthetase beta chain